MEQRETKLTEKILGEPLFEKFQNCLAALPAPQEKVCFFDIETTGLSPQISSVYLIGAAFWETDGVMLVQWFAEDYISEKDLLSAFVEFASSFTTFVHYNGSTFDIPYLEKKYRAHGLSSPFEGRDSLDIFREIRKKKELFATPNLKLATMEKLLGFRRQDTYTGKDCIELYTEFMQKKVFRDEKAVLLQQSLLLHNRDDLIGTILCSQLLYYTRFFGTSPSCHTEQGMLVICDTITGSYPIARQWERNGVFFTFDNNRLEIRVSLYRGTLYHFYKDYKNYFYLPEEDMAVHKSVGIYVDASRREKASAATCYTKKTGVFLPLPGAMKPEALPLFQETRKSRNVYLALEEPVSLSEEFLIEFIQHLFL
ncbi:MAG: ribonuclease H-like domain-containing protein [Lachnospiraceae bacterium]|nr:ribonuclease H-like domain-containing protein [Lachnospiraceae bacterium]